MHNFFHPTSSSGASTGPSTGSSARSTSSFGSSTSTGRCVLVTAAGLRVTRVRFCWQAQRLVSPSVGVGGSVLVAVACRFGPVPGWGGELSAFPQSPFRGPVGESGGERALVVMLRVLPGVGRDFVTLRVNRAEGKRDRKGKKGKRRGKGKGKAKKKERECKRRKKETKRQRKAKGKDKRQRKGGGEARRRAQILRWSCSISYRSFHHRLARQLTGMYTYTTSMTYCRVIPQTSPCA